MPNLKYSGRLLMTAALAASTTLTGPTFAIAGQRDAIRLAQADDALVAPPGGEAPREQRRPKPDARPEAEPEARKAPDAEGAPPRRQRGEPQEGAAERQPGEDAQPPRARRQAQPEGAAAEAPRPEAPAPADEPPTRRDRRQPAADDGAGAPPPAAEGNAEAPRRDRRNRQDAQPENENREAPPAAPEEGGGKPAPRPRNAEPAAEAPAAKPPAPAPEGEGAERPAPKRRQSAEPAETPPPAEPTEAAPKGKPPAPGKAPAGETTRATPDTSAPAAAPAPAPAGEVPAAPPAPRDTPAAPNAATAPGAPDATPAVPKRTEPAPEAPRANPEPGRPAPEGAAPVPGAPATPETAPAPGTATPRTETQPGTAAPPPPAPPPAASLQPKAVPADIQNAPVQRGRIDQSDARVQTLQAPVVVQPITQERGERLREAPRYDLPPDVNVVKRDGDRQIISLGAAAVAGAVAGAAAGYFIRSNDDDRLGVDSRERYTERLPRGRTRETIVRDNGVQVVTITNRYGDVVQRSRVMPDGREVVLFYDPYSADEQRPDYFEDPGRDLPPIRVTIPEDEYVVDVDRPDEELYYDTLVAPPVETVERIYSIDEVRRSPRIREKVRRIDLATINFDFASASIAQDQVDKLQDLAEAIQKIVKENPGETFLIEGHTDAVGSNEANLVLSDKRAEAVASALTQYFDVPAENLVTQGYGEQELKVNTPGQNRGNRRVTVRRITALVKPVETSAR